MINGLIRMAMHGIELVICVAIVMTKLVNTLEPFFINVKLKVIRNINNTRIKARVIHALILEQTYGLAKCQRVNIVYIELQLKAIKQRAGI